MPPVYDCTAAGLKVTVNVHEAPGPSVVPQLSVWANGADAWMLEIANVVDRLFVTETVRAVLVVPAA